MKKIISGILSGVIFASLFSNMAYATNGLKNVALRASASAVSVYAAGDEFYPAKNAIDGDIETFYASGYAGERINAITLTLEKKAKIDEIRFLSGTNFHSGYRKNISISISVDGTTWKEVYNVGSEGYNTSLQTVVLNDDTYYKYVKFEKTDGNSTDLGFNEIEVMSSDELSLRNIAAAASATSTYLDLSASNAIDGLEGTQWASGYYPNGKNAITITLEGMACIDEINFKCSGYGANYQKNFDILVAKRSDFSDGVKVYGTSGETLGTDWINVNVKEITDAKYKYVKFIRNDTDGADLGFAEISVMSSDTDYAFNAAEKATATGSTYYLQGSEETYSYQKAIDGSAGSTWASVNYAAKNYLLLTLNKETFIDSIEFKSGNLFGMASSSSNFSVYVSKTSDFSGAKCIYTTSGNAGTDWITAPVADGEAYKYVKFEKNVTQDNFQIDEVNIWGVEVADEDETTDVAKTAVFSGSTYYLEGAEETYSYEKASDGDTDTCWAGIDSGSKNYLLITLEKETAIDRIEFISGNSFESELSSSDFSVYLSKTSDFADAKRVYTIDGSAGTDWITASVADGEKYKYVKFEKNVAGDVFQINEVKIWNVKDAVSSGGLTVSAVSATNNSTEIEFFPEDGIFAIKLSGTGYSEDKYFSVFKANYDPDDTLISIETVKKQLCLGADTDNFEKIFSVSADEFTSSCAFYVWEIGTMRPLSNKFVISYDENGVVEKDPVNVARGKTVTAGSSHAYYPASQLVNGAWSDNGDGNQWTTDQSIGMDSSKAYAIIDLGKEYGISSIVGEMWVNSYSTGSNAKIYVSNDADFADSIEVGSIKYESGKQTIEVDSSTKYRYVKVQGGAWTGRRWGLWELEVYSTDE